MNLAKNAEFSKSSQSKRMGIKENFRNPQFILDQISEFVKEGDIASTTDLISAYVTNSPKYKSQEEFAEAIGTTRQTLHRLFANENVSLNIFFKAIDRIYDDAHGDD